MNRNVRIAKELVKLAKSLVAARFSDGLGEDTGTEEEGNTNSLNDRQYNEVLEKLYPMGIARSLINMGEGLDRNARRSGGHAATMGNGNMYMKYEAFPREKQFIIMGFVSKARHLSEQDKEDVYNLFKFLERQVEDGYEIRTGCNRYSLPFLVAFAKKNGYYFMGGSEYNEFGNAGLNENNLSRDCVVRKRRDWDGEGNADQMYSTDSMLDRAQRRREEGLRRIVEEREK